MASISRISLFAIAFAIGCAGQPDATICATGIICPAETKCAAVQQVCLINDCGDGIVQTTEKCDDGNILDGDGCAANCLSREECGDGVINAAAGELCDDSNTDGGDGCAADCRSVEVCGNGIRDVNEVCDDGNTVPGDGCAGTCLSTEVCGNGVVDVGEKCDDGSTPGGCNPDCQGGTGCGDGAIDIDGSGNPLEECDDGNPNNQDDCTTTCKLNICGDGIIQTSGVRVEDCDPSVNFGETASCNIDCSTRECGDGKINNAAGEQCDDALSNGTDRNCLPVTCTLNVCGDGFYNQFGAGSSEQCDDGNSIQTDGCSNECTTPSCGNGVIESNGSTPEACDDFNTTDGDGCSHDCKFESCGDGVVNNGEACDPGAAGETSTCNRDCTTRACGDNRINKAAGEECDDGNNVDGDSCRMTTCKKNICGDGDKSPTEGCDDGNAVNTDACTNSCSLPTCGDGVQNNAEPCDDGNASNTDRCLNTCVLASCGDGFTGPGEECDAGINNGATKNCTPQCKNNVCGDGFQDQEGISTEVCDQGAANAPNTATCPYGVQSCQLCRNDCNQVMTKSGNICGDGVPVSPETCDDGDLDDETVCPYGEPNGACTVCNSTCTDEDMLTNGSFCGDKVTDTSDGESCDDGNATCGQCDAACNNAKTATAATGFMVVPASSPLGDNDRFTINDGYGTTLTFEFDTNGNGVSNAAFVEIDAPAAETSTQMRDRVKNAINGTALKITATDAGLNGIQLTHDRTSSLGNQDIVDDVTTSQMYISEMTGGVAGDCADGATCRNDGDCSSGDCNGGSCVAVP